VRLCLDEHYSAQIAVELRERGHDVDCVKERPDLIQLSDSELLSQVQGEQRAILTENVADFMPLIRAMVGAGESHHGVVFTSSRSMPRHRGTIGLYVDALDRLMRAYPGEQDFIDRVEWLTPRS
jgi:hypothetical protein